MFRKRFQRRFAATLALVTALALAGAQPVAAVEPGFANRLANLWSAVAGGEPIELWKTVIDWFSGTEKAAVSEELERGGAYDPNGQHAIQVPVSGDGSH